MGLDNGVCIKTLDIDLPYYKESQWLAGQGETEVCYWRKFWGFRNEIVEHFKQEEACADIYLDVNNIDEFIEILEEYLDRNYYDNYGDSIWAYEEYLVHNVRCLENLKYVKEYLKDYPNVKCYFYDSY